MCTGIRIAAYVCRQRIGYYDRRERVKGPWGPASTGNMVVALAALPRVILLKKSLKEVGLRGPIWLNRTQN